MNTQNTPLHYYDIYPKMVKSNTKTKIKITPRTFHVEFKEDIDYTIMVLPLKESLEEHYGDKLYFTVKPTRIGKSFEFTYEFCDEQEYFVRILGKDDKLITQLSVYALDEDLYARRPYKGDLHVHTCFSDGVESPEYTVGVYRKYGYDFLAITDHGCYKSSLRAIDAYKDVNIDLKLFPGEEVHLPKNHIHIVNFGSDFSVNDYCYENEERYFSEVKEIEATLTDLPDGVSSFEVAACMFVHKKITEGNGLSIFAHPHWIANVYHVKDTMTTYLLKNKVCAAFELLGGQTLTENIPQIAFYNEARSMGINDIPIVGSSDTHGVINNKQAGSFDQIKTICFAKSDEKSDIINSIKDHYSVAVDSYPNEHPRIHGRYRMVLYTLFLLNNYFPIHDDLCYEEGRMMLEYINDEDKSSDSLNFVHKRTKKFLDKCFG